MHRASEEAAEKAIAVLEKMIWAAKNGNQDGENAVVAAAAGLELLHALELEDDLIVRTQDILRMYLEPDESRIKTAEECIQRLLLMLDGPQQRTVQKVARNAIARARGES